MSVIEGARELALSLTGTPGNYLGHVNGVPSSGQRGDFARDRTSNALYVCTGPNAFLTVGNTAETDDVALATAAASASAVADTAAVGTGTTAARSDHLHGREAFATTPSTSAVGDAAAAGTGTTPPRGDHKHARESFGASASTSAVGDAAAAGTASTPSRSDHKHARESVIPQTYAGATAYAIGAFVIGSDSKVYVSATAANTGNDPTTDAGAHWKPLWVA